MIPKRFIRIWIGNTEIPQQFEIWWEEFKKLHPDYEFMTLTDFSSIPPHIEIGKIIPQIGTCAGISDVLRLLALYHFGGIYVDTDIMPIKNFDPLLEDGKPFLAKRSGKSFESAVIGSPSNHPAFKLLLDKLPEWFYEHKNSAASVQTGPTFVSSVLFGREDITHLPIKTFYPYNGFMAPKKNEKIKMFSNKNNFPEEMYAAHFSNHQWGGKPFSK